MSARSSVTLESSELQPVKGRWGDMGLLAQMVKDDNENVSVFATGEQTAMLETNQHAARLQRRAWLPLSLSESVPWSISTVLQKHDTSTASVCKKSRSLPLQVTSVLASRQDTLCESHESFITRKVHALFVQREIKWDIHADTKCQLHEAEHETFKTCNLGAVYQYSWIWKYEACCCF